MRSLRHRPWDMMLLGMTVGAVLWLGALSATADEPRTSAPIRVAIYDDAGGNAKGPLNCERCLPQARGFATRRLQAADIRGGLLANFDVLIQPGGTGSGQAKALEQPGRAAIRSFVEQGGGYVGICAGAYLASADYEWSLGLLDAKVLDRKHWARGKGDVQIRLDSLGQQFLAEKQEVVTVWYAQGPLLAPADKPDIPDYERLAVFETEMAKGGAPPGVMKGTTAAARGTFGRGHVFCFSPHPEQTPGLDHYIEAAVRWAADSNAAPASK
jgi:biotin protein ligase-like protein